MGTESCPKDEKREGISPALAVECSHLAVHNRIVAIGLIYSFVYMCMYDEKEDKYNGSFK